MVNKNNSLRDSRHLEKYFPYVDFIRRPTSADIRHPKTGRIYSKPFFWRVKNFPDGTAPDSGTEGELWYLVDITANSANWVLLSTATHDLSDLRDQVNANIVPSGAGEIDIDGVVVANAANPSAIPVETVKSGTANTMDLQVQVGAAVSGAPGDKNDAGLASFESAHFNVDADGHTTLKNPIGPSIGATNLSMTYSAGTVTIRGADGNALSATNPAYITLPSNASADQLVTVTMTANKTFDDSAGTSVFAGSLFGMDASDDSTGQSRPIPFWIYPILDDNDANLIFAVSRVPQIKITTNTNGTGGINDAAGGGADNAMELLALETITVGNYDNNFTASIGSLDLEINGLDDWTVVDVDSEKVGMGRVEIAVRNYPLGLNGAATSSYFKANGGTAPTINNSDQFGYKIWPNGMVEWEMSFRLTGSPAGAVDALLITPIKGGTGTTFQQLGTWTDGTDALTTFPISFFRLNADDDMELRKSDGSSAKWQYEEFTLDDVIRGTLTWQL